MRVLLAPMEGVLDSLVRELLTEVNDYDLCVTEFLRVVDMLLPVKSFFRLCPELHNQSRTSSGTLVRIQLLGQYPEWLAENAARAVELGHGLQRTGQGLPLVGVAEVVIAQGVERAVAVEDGDFHGPDSSLDGGTGCQAVT